MAYPQKNTKRKDGKYKDYFHTPLGRTSDEFEIKNGKDKNHKITYEEEKERQNIIDSYEAEQKEKSRYNGWSNYLTWSVALNIDNDQYFQEEVTKQVGEGKIKNGYELKDWFKQSLEDSEMYNEDYDVYKLSDSWTNRELEEVDWNEIYDSYKRNYEEEKKYKESKK